MTHTEPLPRADVRDRRTRAQRTPQVPVSVTVRVRNGEGTRIATLEVLVGIGGWSGDERAAAARALDLPTDDVTVLTVQGGRAR